MSETFDEVKRGIRRAFRDYDIDGNPASGAHDPNKSEIRSSLADALVNKVSEVAQASISGRRVYSTIAERDSWSDRPIGAQAYVEETDLSYRWDGSSWVVFTDPATEAAEIATDAANAAAASAASVEDLRDAVGDKRNLITTLLEVDIDSSGNVMRAFGPDGTQYFTQVIIGARLEGEGLPQGGGGMVGEEGALRFFGSVKPGSRLIVEERELTGKWADALEVDLDQFGFVMRAKWKDGQDELPSALSGPSIEQIEIISLPDSAYPNPNGGFTSTGASEIGSTGQFASCIIVGNDGRITESGTVYHSGVLILSPDMRKVVREFRYGAPEFIIPGIRSIQGVAWDESDDTTWVVDKRNGLGEPGVLRHINMSGALLNDAITAPISPTFGVRVELNGIARHPGLDALFVANEGQQELLLVSCADGSILRHWNGNGLAGAADHWSYDSETGLLAYTYGNNGSGGMVRIWDPEANGGAGGTVHTFGPLDGIEAIEGIIMRRGEITVVSDGAFHVAAKPPLALAGRYKFSLG